MKPKKNCLIFSILVTCFLITGSLAIAGPTLTCGGKILQAADSTSADGGKWSVYNPVDSPAVAEGGVGDFSSGYWAGEVGFYLDGLAVDDELVVIIEKDTTPGTIDHKGYYAVMNHILTNSDPSQFDECNLREIPVPSVAIAGNDVQLNWDGAAEDSETVNIIGYNVYRSDYGIHFLKINSEIIPDTSYSDH